MSELDPWGVGGCSHRDAVIDCLKLMKFTLYRRLSLKLCVGFKIQVFESERFIFGHES